MLGETAVGERAVGDAGSGGAAVVEAMGCGVVRAAVCGYTHRITKKMGTRENIYEHADKTALTRRQQKKVKGFGGNGKGGRFCKQDRRK